MSTTRTHTAKTPGPVTFVGTTEAHSIDVMVEAGRQFAEVTVSTTDDEGASADAVNATEFADAPGRLFARLPKGAGGVSIVQTGRGGFQSVNFSGGGGIIVTGSGAIQVGGGHIYSGGAVVVGGAQITVSARLPKGSSLDARTVSGDIRATGALTDVRASTTSGDITIDGGTDIDARSVSGDVDIQRLAGNANASSTSGDIIVHAITESRARLSSVSGNVTTSRAAGVDFDVDANTVSGRVRNR
jgi:hypothetical protein